MSRLTLRLFGIPRLEVDGRPVVTDHRKALALLVYLSLNDLDYTREALATLLWPDQDTSHVLRRKRYPLPLANASRGQSPQRARRPR